MGRQDMATRKHCDICGFTRPDIKTYGLAYQRKNGEGKATYGAGSLDLCDECWTRTAAPKMRPGTKRGRGFMATHIKVLPPVDSEGAA